MTETAAPRPNQNPNPPVLWLRFCGLALMAVSLGVWAIEAQGFGDRLREVIIGWGGQDGDLYHVCRRVSSVGHGNFVAVIAICALAWTRDRALLGRMLAMILFCTLASTILKGLVDRPRPDGNDHAWPSGHSSMSLGIALSFLPTYRRTFFVALPVVVLIASARILSVRHWPADVLGGLGLAMLVASFVLARRVVAPRWMVSSRSVLIIAILGCMFVYGRLAFAEKKRRDLVFSIPLITAALVTATRSVVAGRRYRFPAPSGERPEH